VGLLLAVSVTGASAANLITNPGFESGDLTGWQVFGLSGLSTVTVQSPDNGPAAPGTHNAFMDNQAMALGLTLKQSTAPGSATGGTVYYSFDLKLGQAANGGVFFVQIFAEASGIGIVGGSGLLGNYAPAGWMTYSGSFVAPANTDFLSMQFMANTGAVLGSVSSMHVDNVDLHQDVVVPVEPTNWSGVKALFQ
jgi:hypothetical protein